jgi:hypothetical protein
LCGQELRGRRRKSRTRSHQTGPRIVGACGMVVIGTPCRRAVAGLTGHARYSGENLTCQPVQVG